MTTSCVAINRRGLPCLARVQAGKSVCRTHDNAPEVIAARLEASSRGGLNRPAAGAQAIAPLETVIKIADVDLTTAAGLRTFLAAVIGHLGRLPWSAQVANAITLAAGAQRSTIETTDLELRIEALEAAKAIGPGEATVSGSRDNVVDAELVETDQAGPSP